MLDYARNRPVVAGRQSSPNALLVIIAAHVALVAVVMSVKMDLPQKLRHDPIVVDLIPEPVPPPLQRAPQAPATPHPQSPAMDQPQPPLPTPPIVDPHVDSLATNPNSGASLGGAGAGSLPGLPPLTPAPVHRDPRLLTPPSELKPPYPAAKLFSGEEATLTLRLTIDERGRVIAVDPVGRADREFFDAARRYLIAHWRYQPASDDGRAVATSITVTLRFELDG